MEALDLSPMIDAVDTAPIVVGLLAIGALMIVPRIASMGVHWIKMAVDSDYREGVSEAWRQRNKE